MPVISLGTRTEAGKMTAATSLGLAEGAPWRRGRNTQFNMKLSAYILVPFTTLGRRPRVPFGALLGRVIDEVSV